MQPSCIIQAVTQLNSPGVSTQISSLCWDAQQHSSDIKTEWCVCEHVCFSILCWRSVQVLTVSEATRRSGNDDGGPSRLSGRSRDRCWVGASACGQTHNGDLRQQFVVRAIWTPPCSEAGKPRLELLQSVRFLYLRGEWAFARFNIGVFTKARRRRKGEQTMSSSSFLMLCATTTQLGQWTLLRSRFSRQIVVTGQRD